MLLRKSACQGFMRALSRRDMAVCEIEMEAFCETMGPAVTYDIVDKMLDDAEHGIAQSLRLVVQHRLAVHDAVYIRDPEEVEFATLR